MVKHQLALKNGSKKIYINLMQIFFFFISMEICNKSLAMDSYNTMITIEMDSEKINKNKEFFNKLSEINNWINSYCQLNNIEIEKYKIILSNLKTHAFLYYYENDLINLEEAKIESILENFENLWETRDQIKKPTTLEDIFAEQDQASASPSKVIFSKIERHLYDKYDERLDKLMSQHMQDGIDFAYPIVEWASNIMLLDFDNYIETHKELTKDNLKKYITINYNKDDLKKHITKGWKILTDAFSAITIGDDNSVQNNKFIELLSCSECYPARLAILEGGEKSLLESPKKPGDEFDNLEKITNDINLYKWYDSLFYKTCKTVTGINDLIMNTSICDEKITKKTICNIINNDFETEFKNEYLKKFNISNKNLEIINNNNYKIIKDTIKSAYNSIFDEMPCS